MRESTPHVELRGVEKHYGGAQALRGIDLSIAQGTIHGLVGENGAGKSTLGKIIAGVVQPNHGQLLIEGQPVTLRSPRDALARGLTMIAQEVTLAGQQRVLDNVFLGHERARFCTVSRRALRSRFDELAAVAGFSLSPDVLTGSLRTADQQQVEILRALARDARLIVMDEPTAALASAEVERLFEIVRRLRERGTTVVYVSHRLEEVLALADRVTVMRDGAEVETTLASEEDPSSLVEKMLGRPMDVVFPRKRSSQASARVALEVRGLTRPGAFQDVSLHVGTGEIVALAGLVGSGRSEVARAVFGVDQHVQGEIALFGEPARIRSSRAAIELGIAMLPESRKTQGLLMGRALQENIALASLASRWRTGVISSAKERRATGEIATKLDIRPLRLATTVRMLSGGNQQKALFAKWLLAAPRILIADEPTRGVDVGAKHAIYELLTSLAEDGMAVLLISSELEEVVGLAHRVYVMHNGSVTAELSGNQITEETIMEASFGKGADVLAA